MRATWFWSSLAAWYYATIALGSVAREEHEAAERALRRWAHAQGSEPEPKAQSRTVAEPLTRTRHPYDLVRDKRVKSRTFWAPNTVKHHDNNGMYLRYRRSKIPWPSPELPARWHVLMKPPQHDVLVKAMIQSHAATITACEECYLIHEITKVA